MESLIPGKQIRVNLGVVKRNQGCNARGTISCLGDGSRYMARSRLIGSGLFTLSAHVC